MLVTGVSVNIRFGLAWQGAAMYVLPFLLILVLVAAKLGSLLDPRRNARLFMKYHTDSCSF